MYRADRTIHEAADEYDRLLRSRPPLDVVHLGLGPDGHTASLVPGSPALDERGRLVVATGDDAHPHPRLTLTFAGIERSRFVVVTVEGEEKRDAWRRVVDGDDVPAARVRAERLLWLVDPEARS
jgi:6-phosphogluconolactonase